MSTFSKVNGSGLRLFWKELMSQLGPGASFAKFKLGVEVNVDAGYESFGDSMFDG